MKPLRNIGRLLTRHRVGYQQDLVRRGHRFNLCQLVHERFVDLQPPRGVDDDRRQRKALGLGDAFARDTHGIVRAALINREIDLFAERLQLLDCRRTIDVCSN